MLDVVLVLMTLGLFALAQGYTAGCQRLKGERP